MPQFPAMSVLDFGVRVLRIGANARSTTYPDIVAAMRAEGWNGFPSHFVTTVQEITAMTNAMADTAVADLSFKIKLLLHCVGLWSAYQQLAAAEQRGPDALLEVRMQQSDMPE